MTSPPLALPFIALSLKKYTISSLQSESKKLPPFFSVFTFSVFLLPLFKHILILAPHNLLAMAQYQ